MITAEEFLRVNFEIEISKDRIGYVETVYAYKAMIAFAKYHVEQALKEACENADTIYRGDSFGDYVVDKNSILNSYPPENIK
jgi:hypothetical protein